jgi:Uma2 family endonuclease
MHMATTAKRWTLDELHSLPDDGNKYELVRGELYVTPPPTVDHETVSSRLARILDPYVENHRLGLVYRPRSVLRFEGSEVEPDLMVRQPPLTTNVAWEKLPIPILVIETISDSTRRRDLGTKRDFYMDAGVAEYWIVDPSRMTITVVRKDEGERVIRDRLLWQPAEASAPLVIELAAVFATPPT